MSYDPDHFRFSEGRNGVVDSGESPVDLSGREGAPPSNCRECSERLDDEDFDRFGTCKECRKEEPQ